MNTEMIITMIGVIAFFAMMLIWFFASTKED